MFNLGDPILMAIMQAIAGQNQGQGQQSNPDIYQDPFGVYRNRTPNPQPEGTGVVAMPGDYATEQYLNELAARNAYIQKMQQDAAAAEAKAEEQRLASERALQLEGLKQQGTLSKTEMEQTGGMQRTLVGAVEKILGNEFGKPEDKMAQIQELLKTFQQAPAAPAPTEAPAAADTITATGIKDPKTQLENIRSLLQKYNTVQPPNAAPSIGMKDPRFAQPAPAKDPNLAADIARRIVIFGMENKVTPDSIIKETSIRPDIPQEIKTLVAYYAKQYGGL